MGSCRVWVGFLLLALIQGPLGAQEPGTPPPSAETVRLFFDCQGFGCWDMDFFRREIPYVNWVRDREDADVHVLVTTQTTGGGGRQYVLAYLGRGRFDGQNQDLEINTGGDATDDEVRTAIAAGLRMGLGRYLAATDMGMRLRVTLPGGGPEGGRRAESQGQGAQDDPWDSWVFRVGANGFSFGESSISQSYLSSSVSANRTTDAWKVHLSGRYNRRKNTFELSDGTLESVTEDWTASALVVKSLTDHWSMGVRGGAGRSTTLNEDFRWNVSPGLEFNVFPYTESSRRSLTFQALFETRHFDYQLPTIFDQEAETRTAATLTAGFSVVQPWGNMSVGVDHSRYLHDRKKYRLSADGHVEMRLFKGFSVNVGGFYGRIRDQLYIALEGATDEEILLQRKQLATDYQYSLSFGISYRFGSIFNNVVNPRFGGEGGGGRFIMF